MVAINVSSSIDTTDALNGGGSGCIILGREGELDPLPSASPFLLTQPEFAEYAMHDRESEDEEWFPVHNMIPLQNQLQQDKNNNRGVATI